MARIMDQNFAQNMAHNTTGDNEFKDLRNLLPYLDRIKTTKPSSIPAESSCYVCMHEFGTPGDENEVPCEPLQLSCGHLIGDKCFKKLPHHQKIKCQLCQRFVEHRSFVPEWFTSLVSVDRYSFIYPAGLIPFAGTFLKGETGQSLMMLQAKLFDGTYTRKEAIKLWSLHLHAPTTVVLGMAGIFAATKAVRLVILYMVPWWISQYINLGYGVQVLLAPCLSVISLKGLMHQYIQQDPNEDWQNDWGFLGPLYACAFLYMMSIEWFQTSLVMLLYTYFGFSAAADYVSFLVSLAGLYCGMYAFMTGGLIYQGYRLRHVVQESRRNAWGMT